MWPSLFCYSVWCQQVSPQLLSDHPGCAGCWCSIALWSLLQMSAYLRWVVGRIRVNERLRDMVVETRTSVWALFKRAAGDSGKTSLFSLGLTWIGTAYSVNDRRWKASEARRRILDWLKELKRLTVRTPLITLPRILWFMVSGGYATYTALAGIWKPCITVRLFTWP